MSKLKKILYSVTDKMAPLKNLFTEKAAKAVISVLTAATLFGVMFFFWSAQTYEAQALEAAINEEELAEQLLLLEENQLLREKLAAVQQENNTLSSAQAENEELLSAKTALNDDLVLEYVGEYKTTAYCCEVYPHICGGNGVTASGTVPTPGITCAADWGVLPPGTWLYIEDVGIRRVEDSGSAIKGNRLDIAVDTHDNALRWPGFGTHKVWVLSWAEE